LRSMKRTRVWLPALTLFSILMLGTFLLPQVYSVAGVWRLISPTEFTTFPAAAVHGIYTLNGGTGSIGAGNAWAVGDNGFIFHWDGFSWRQFGPSPSGCTLYSVNFGGPLIPSGSNFAGVSNTLGWIVGGNPGCGVGAATALYYDGTGWSTQTNGLGAAIDPLRSVYTVTGSSSVEAWAVGGSGAAGQFWHWFGTPGGGGAWTEVSAGVATASVNGVYMTHGFTLGSADEGWAVGNGGKVYKWFGGSWNVFQTVNPSSCGPVPDLMSVAMSSTTDGWAVGTCGSIYHFTGGTWNGPVSAGTTTNDLLSIVLLNNNEGWAVGKADPGFPFAPTILHGTNLQGAPSWNRIPINKLPGFTGGDFFSVTFGVSGNNIWAVGSGGLMALCSSGCSDSSVWGTTTSPLFGSSLESVFMTGDNDGWAVGLAAFFGLTEPQIFHWDGATFTRGVAVASNKDLLGVYMTSSSEGWAVGGTLAGPTTEATVHYTGGTWTDVPPPGCACVLRGIYMIGNNNGWAVGSGGKIEHLTTSSGPWTLSANIGAPVTDLYSVFFDPANSNSGWAVGGGGGNPPVIIHTTNGGLDGWASAVVQPGGIAATVTLRSIYMRDSNHIWVVGDQSTILFSGNNGATWTAQLIAGVANPPLFLYGVFLDSNNDGWAVGRDSANFPIAVHYDGTGWTQIPFTTPVPNTGTPSLVSVFLTSSTNGLAVGDNAGAGTLALAFHLDPPGLYGTGTTSTPTTATSTSSSATSSVTTSSTSAATSSSSATTSSSETSASESATSSTTVTIESSATSSSATETITQTVTPMASVTSQTSSETSSETATTAATTPLALPAIPGFPWESIIIGVILGLATLAIVRRRRKASHGPL